jgi:YYY domain-containing protein
VSEAVLLVRWLLLYGALLVAGLPVARVLFPSAPDDGAGLAIPVSTVVVTIVAFYIGQFSFGPWTALASVGALVAFGAAGHVLARRRGLAAYNWGRVAGAFAVFAAGFLFMLSFRAMDPLMSGWGGEKFLHTGLLNAVLRSGALPPEDMWFAGEAVRYYYGLPVFNAVAALVTDTSVEYVHNLALAGYFGSLVVGAYSLCGWLARDRGVGRRLGGALGVFFVALAGNAVTSVRFALGLLPDDLAVEWGRAAFNLNRSDYPQILFEQSSIDAWGWWDTRYVVEGTLQEFPLYSFVKADMHGHTVTTPFLVLSGALAYAYVQTPETSRTRRWGLLFGGLGVVAGYFGLTNTWSMPSAVGLAWLAVVFAGPHPATLLPDAVGERLRDVPPRVETGAKTDGGATDDALGPRLLSEAWRTVLAAVVAAAVGVVGYVVASPFLLSSVPPNEGIGLFPPRTTAVGVLLIYGGLLALFVTYVVTRFVPLDRDERTSTAVRSRPRAAAGALLAVVAVVALAASVGDLGGIALLFPVVAAAWVAMQTRRNAGFEAVLLVAGVGLVLSMELVHAHVHPFELDRWNTTLKVAIQAWVLAGLAAGPVAAILWREAQERLPRFDAASLRCRLGSTASSLAVVGVVVLVVASASLFPALVVKTDVVEPYEDDTQPSVDGYEGHWEDHPEQMAAIQWFDREASGTQSVLWMERRTGTPVFVEAAGLSRGWENPVATLTGLPTVAGWFHEEGYRGDNAYQVRVDDVEIIYETEDAASRAALFRKHDVEYVWVGPLEREQYDVASMADEPGIEPVFENDAVTIYAVDQSELADTPT